MLLARGLAVGHLDILVTDLENGIVLVEDRHHPVFQDHGLTGVEVIGLTGGLREVDRNRVLVRVDARLPAIVRGNPVVVGVTSRHLIGADEIIHPQQICRAGGLRQVLHGQADPETVPETVHVAREAETR